MQAAAATAVFILRENIHCGVYSLTATKLFDVSSICCFGQKGISLLVYMKKKKSIAVWFLNDVKTVFWENHSQFLLQMWSYFIIYALDLITKLTFEYFSQSVPPKHPVVNKYKLRHDSKKC